MQIGLVGDWLWNLRSILGELDEACSGTESTIFFSHIPKTGGVMLRIFHENQFSRSIRVSPLMSKESGIVFGNDYNNMAHATRLSNG
jgi:hypothetical protein